MKPSELTGELLDYWVAQTFGAQTDLFKPLELKGGA
jgi:hypothetical protein